MRKYRTYLLAFVAVVAAMAVGGVIVHVESTADGALAGPNEVVVSTTATTIGTTTTTVAPTTTVDPAAVDQFLEAWRLSETTTTTAPPPPPPPPTTQPPAPAPDPAPAPAATGGGSGCVIPAYICQRESGFSYTALNASSGAGGMYQFMPSTWNGIARQIAPEWVGTPPHLAPPSVQDQFASYLWAGGAGCGHWSAC